MLRTSLTNTQISAGQMGSRKDGFGDGAEQFTAADSHSTTRSVCGRAQALGQAMKLNGWTRLGIALSGLWVCVMIAAVAFQLHSATTRESGVLVELVRGTANESRPFSIDSKTAPGKPWVVAVINYPVALGLLVAPLVALWLGARLSQWVAIGFYERNESSAPASEQPPHNRGQTDQKSPAHVTRLFREHSRLAAGIAAFIGALWLLGLALNDSKSNTPSSAQHQAPSRSLVTAEHALPLPNSGTIRRHTNAGGVAPLQIHTRSGTNFLVKLENSDWRIEVLDVFVRGGETVDISVPLGNYIVKYASGNSWYGYKNYFGPDTVYSKADSTLHFTSDGNQYSGYTITLYRVVDGNLSTSQISASQF